MKHALQNGFMFLKTGYKDDSPQVAYTLNIESVKAIEEKGNDPQEEEITQLEFACTGIERVTPDRIIEYAYGKQKQQEIVTCGNCKRYIRHDKRCGYWNHGVKPTMWCSQAERLLIGEK